MSIPLGEFFVEVFIFTINWGPLNGLGLAVGITYHDLLRNESLYWSKKGLESFKSQSVTLRLAFLTYFWLWNSSDRISSQSRPLDVVYSSPWMRVAPYLIGMFTGYLVVHFKGKFILKKVLRPVGLLLKYWDLFLKKLIFIFIFIFQPNLIVCWILGVGCGIWALFGLRENASPFLIVFHAASSRIAWSFCLSWIVVACCTNKASKKFFSIQTLRKI